MARVVVRLLLLIAVVLLAGPARSTLAADGWQIEPEPALTTGQLTDWDDFQVGAPCLVPVDRGWRMYFEGACLNEDGLIRGIGVATSDDGRTWKKFEHNPIAVADDPEHLRSPWKCLKAPTVCRLADESWLMICTETDQNHGTSRSCILQSADGFDWKISPAAEAAFAKAAAEARLHSLSFCVNPQRREQIRLWGLKRTEGGRTHDVTKLNTVLLQTVDGKSWKQVLERSVTEIEPTGAVRDLRFSVEGESWIVCYLFAAEESQEPTVLRFRQSADGIRWKPAGVPDYALPVPSTNEERMAVSRPALLTGESGPRLFFTEQQENGSRWVVTASMSKGRPRSTP